MHSDGRDGIQSLIESTFLDLEYQVESADTATLHSRLRAICDVWPFLSTPYEFLKLAHFLESDSSTVSTELYDAALRTAWRLRTEESDPWDDEWWTEAVDAIVDDFRRDALRRFAADT